MQKTTPKKKSINKENEHNKKEEPKSDIKTKSPKKSRSRSRSKSIEKEKKEPKELKKYLPFPTDENQIIKIIHWNVAGFRPLLKTKDLDNLISEENPDIICFNEIKLDPELIEKLDLKNVFSRKHNYKSYWYCPTEKKGYSGTGILTKYEPISVSYGMNIPKHDNEGRIITLEYEKFYLICCYTPNAGEGLKRLNYRVNEWDKDFFEFMNKLKEKKDVILTGDLNVAKDDIDIFDPKGRNKLAGFTKEERESFNKFLNMGYIDNFRELHPKEKKFSYFSKRFKDNKTNNKGWRLDYFVTNKDLKNIEVKGCDIIDKDKYNASDHIPIVFTFNLKK